MGSLSLQTALHWLEKINENQDPASGPLLENSIKKNKLIIKPHGSFYGTDNAYYDVLRDITFGTYQQNFNQRKNPNGTQQFPVASYLAFKMRADAELTEVGCTNEENQVFMSLGLQNGGVINTSFAIVDKIIQAWGLALDNRGDNCDRTTHVTKENDRLTCTQVCVTTQILHAGPHGGLFGDLTKPPIFTTTNAPALKLTTKFSVKTDDPEHYRYGVDTINIELHPQLKKLLVKKIEQVFNQENISDKEVEKLLPLLEFDAEFEELIFKRLFKRNDPQLIKNFVKQQPSLQENKIFLYKLTQYLYEHSDSVLFDLLAQQRPSSASNVLSIYNQKNKAELLIEEKLKKYGNTSPRFKLTGEDPTPKLTRFFQQVATLAKEKTTLPLAVRFSLNIVKDARVAAYLIKHGKLDKIAYAESKLSETNDTLVRLINRSPALIEACLDNKSIVSHYNEWSENNVLLLLADANRYNTRIAAHFALANPSNQKTNSILCKIVTALESSTNKFAQLTNQIDPQLRAAAINLLAALKADTWLAEKFFKIFPKEISPEVKHELAKKHSSIAIERLRKGDKMSPMEIFELATSHPNNSEVIRRIFQPRWFKKPPCDNLTAAMLLQCYLTSEYARTWMQKKPSFGKKILDGATDQDMAQQLSYVITRFGDATISQYATDFVLKKLIANENLKLHLQPKKNEITPIQVATAYLLQPKYRQEFHKNPLLLGLLLKNTNPTILRALLNVGELTISADKRAEWEIQIKTNQPAAESERKVSAPIAMSSNWRQPTFSRNAFSFERPTKSGFSSYLPSSLPTSAPSLDSF